MEEMTRGVVSTVPNISLNVSQILKKLINVSRNYSVYLVKNCVTAFQAYLGCCYKIMRHKQPEPVFVNV